MIISPALNVEILTVTPAVAKHVLPASVAAKAPVVVPVAGAARTSPLESVIVPVAPVAPVLNDAALIDPLATIEPVAPNVPLPILTDVLSVTLPVAPNACAADTYKP